MRLPLIEFEIEDVNGVLYELGPDTRHALEISGLGMPPIRHWTVRSPFQHGATHWGYAIQPRVVNLVLASKGCGRSGLYGARISNIAMLSPVISPLILRVKISGGYEVYELREGWYQSGYELSSTDQGQDVDGSWNQVGGVQIEFEDPIWKWTSSPLDVGETRDGSGRTCKSTSTFTLTPQLVLPFTFPFVLGTTVGTASLACTNDGSWAVAPYVTVTGPTDDWILTNTTTGTAIYWNGYPILAGTSVILDLKARTVVDGTGNDLADYVSGDLATFMLEPGANALTFWSGGGAINAVTTLSVCWFLELLGI
ncbi:MAG: phage tail family protein [Gammaproteobacteria bacterium]|nr:phage tail family protein [Gammaproteobacteria bacterium]